MDQKDMDEIRAKVKEYNPSPRVRIRPPKHVYHVERLEKYEGSTTIGICLTLAGAKKLSDDTLRGEQEFSQEKIQTELKWEKLEPPYRAMLQAGVRGSTMFSEPDWATSYTITREELKP